MWLGIITFCLSTLGLEWILKLSSMYPISHSLPVKLSYSRSHLQAKIEVVVAQEVEQNMGEWGKLYNELWVLR